MNRSGSLLVLVLFILTLGCMLALVLVYVDNTYTVPSPSPSASTSASAARYGGPAFPSPSASVDPNCVDCGWEFKLREGNWSDPNETNTVYLVHREDALIRHENWYSPYPWVFWWVNREWTDPSEALWFYCGIDSNIAMPQYVAYCHVVKVDAKKHKLGLAMGPSWYGVHAAPFEGMPFVETPPAAMRLVLKVRNEELIFAAGSGEQEYVARVFERPCGLPPGSRGLLAGDGKEPNIPLGIETFDSEEDSGTAL